MARSCILPLLLANLAYAGTCQDLTKLTLPNTTITGARTIALACRVSATLTPTTDSDIKIEVWLPDLGWNGKYLAVGNGGWSGNINYSGLADGVHRGYATSSTNTGHIGGSASFARGHPEKLVDFAYRSEHEMSVTAKAIIESYYGKSASLSYWSGCSAGGRQGLKEAQLYPKDFDGIVAGAPAANFTGRAAQAIWTSQAVTIDQESYLTPAKYRTLHNAVLAACNALDGVLENPRKCTFDPKSIVCSGTDGDDCLTPKQVEAARKIYGPSVNPRTNKPLYPGLERGSELGWATWAGPNPFEIAYQYFQYIVFENLGWDYRKLNFDTDIAQAEKLGSVINALDPNLKPFFARGGKLIQYHGWNDPQISPGNSVDYYNSVVKRLGRANLDASYRLFMVPGMSHCGGGEGTDSFDMIAALEQWVEAKTPPQRIIASRIRNKKVDLTHPLCPYPQIARYNKTGSTGEAENFVCVSVPWR